MTICTDCGGVRGIIGERVDKKARGHGMGVRDGERWGGRMICTAKGSGFEG